MLFSKMSTRITGLSAVFVLVSRDKATIFLSVSYAGFSFSVTAVALRPLLCVKHAQVCNWKISLHLSISRVPFFCWRRH